MIDPKRSIYESSNGDRWFLVRGSAAGRVSILHLPNTASGGQPADLDVEAFLLRDRGKPQSEELLRLIGTLVDELGDA